MALTPSELVVPIEFASQARFQLQLVAGLLVSSYVVLKVVCFWGIAAFGPRLVGVGSCLVYRGLGEDLGNKKPCFLSGSRVHVFDKFCSLSVT